MKVLGLISGSSLDGLDLALCNFTGRDMSEFTWSVTHAITIDFPEQLANKLRAATSLSVVQLKKLEFEFSDFCADAISHFLNDADESADYIASHGHTIYHFPEDGFTVQIGNGALMAERTGIPCITDLRSNDIALGGQGAPVAPIVEQWIYPGYEYYINLGGIANISIHTGSRVLSFDSCPCNQVLNHIAALKGLSYDKGGNLASMGICNDDVKDRMLGDSYFRLPIPKSLDNSWVQNEFIPSYIDLGSKPEDLMATMCHFIGDQLLCDIKEHSPIKFSNSRVLASGGGSHNNFLVDLIRLKFSEIHQEIVMTSST